MILDFWINWIQSSSLIGQLEKEIGKLESSDPKEWKKAASKSTLYKKFIAEKIQDGEQASSHIGNMYTASIFMSLISLFTESIKNKKDISENVIGFLSYGSGSKSKVFEGIIVDSWKDKLNHLSINKSIEQRENIDFETYEKLHNSKIKDPLVSNDSIVLTGIETQENKTGFRYYK
jgi:hydroxymethylglutaryl-CoA synthase